jgi:hypothetical protein
VYTYIHVYTYCIVSYTIAQCYCYCLYWARIIDLLYTHIAIGKYFQYSILLLYSIKESGSTCHLIPLFTVLSVLFSSIQERKSEFGSPT